MVDILPATTPDTCGAAIAVIALPTKLKVVILDAVPTLLPSSSTVLAPGIIPPPTGSQYLVPSPLESL